VTDTKTKIDRRRFNKPPRRVAKPKPQIDPLAGEALRGAGPIAAFLGWDERFTRNALAKGDIPGLRGQARAEEVWLPGNARLGNLDAAARSS
jgi:hypothetical protein